MYIKQLSVFIENKAGRLAEALKVLSDNGIDISALSIADTSEFGILRMIVSDPALAKEKLFESGVIVKTTEVMGIVLEDKPGALANVVALLADNGIVVEYAYAFLGCDKEKALVVISVDNQEGAVEILKNSGVTTINPSDIYRV